MKTLKILGLVVVSSMILLSTMLVGCGGKANDSDPTPTNVQTVGLFELNISVSAKTIKQGEAVDVTMSLKNSGEEINIVSSSTLCLPIFVGRTDNALRLDNAVQSVLANGTTTKVVSVGNNLEKGKHELYANAIFTIADSGEQIEVISNTIFLTVK